MDSLNENLAMYTQYTELTHVDEASLLVIKRLLIL